MKNWLILLFLIFSYSAFSVDCDLIFSRKVDEIPNFWNRLFDKKTNVVFDQEKYLYYLEELKSGSLPHYANTESRMAFITTAVDKEIPGLNMWVDQLQLLSKKESKALVGLTQMFNKNGELLEKKVEKYMSHFFKVYYKTPTNVLDKMQDLEGIFAEELRKKVTSGLLTNLATDHQIIRTRNFFQRSVNRITGSKSFQLSTSTLLNYPMLTTGTPPILLNYKFLRISPKVVDDALLYGTEFAVGKHFHLYKSDVTKQVLYDSTQKILNRVVLVAFMGAAIYESIDGYYQMQEQMKLLEEEGNKIIDQEISNFESDLKETSDALDAIDPREDLFELTILVYEKENNLKIDSTNSDYQSIWKDIFILDYPQKEKL